MDALTAYEPGYRQRLVARGRRSVDAMDGSAYPPASVPRRAAAVILDAAALLALALIVVRRHLMGASAVRRLAVPVAIQAVYFTVTTAIAGGSPGQRLAGLRVVDIGDGRRPTWRQSALRWTVWAGPGIVARILTTALRHPSAKTKARSASLREELDRLAEELSYDPEQLDQRLRAIHRGRRMAAMWAPPAVTVVLLVVYKLTVGRGAHDRLSGTRVVATR